MSITYTQIQLENSLYAHSQQLIDEFNALISKNEQKLYRFLENTVINSHTDFFSSVFNYWVQLIESDEIRPPKIDKMIFHTFTFEMNKLLAENPVTKEFINKKPTNEQIFTFTYFFTYKFLYYMHSHMPKELLEQFIQQKEEIEFYATTDDDFQNELLKDLYLFRKNFLADIVSDMQIRFDIQNIIIQSVNLSSRYSHSN